MTPDIESEGENESVVRVTISGVSEGTEERRTLTLDFDAGGEHPAPDVEARLDESESGKRTGREWWRHVDLEIETAAPPPSAVCPVCGNPVTTTAVLGPTDARVSPCGHAVSPAFVTRRD